MTSLAVTYTLSNGQTSDATLWNTNYSDIVNYINARNNGGTAWESILSSGNVTLSSSTTSTNIRLRVSHTDNVSTSSNALTVIDVGGALGGDPYINFSVTGVTNWAIGIDNSDSDKFKISRNSSLGTNDVFQIDTSSRVGINDIPSSTFRVRVIEGTADAATNSIFTMCGGGNGAPGTDFTNQTTTGVAAATTVLAAGGHAGLVIAQGDDGTNFFSDILNCAAGSSAVTVISSHTVAGAPAARTWTKSGSNLKLAMASGTYTTNVFMIAVNRRG